MINDLMKMKRIRLAALTMMFAGTIMLVASCGGDSGEENAPIPAVTGVNPESGEPGDDITITGTNLGEATLVAFGTVEATIVSNSDTEIVATVPEDAVTGKIFVTTAGGVGVSPNDFTVIVVGAVTVSSVYPVSAQAGENIVITGTDMSTVSSVKVGETDATVVSTTETTVEITIGEGTPIGKSTLTIVNEGGSTTTSTSSTEFYVIRLVDNNYIGDFEDYPEGSGKMNFVGSMDAEEQTVHGKSNDPTVLADAVALPPAIDGVFFQMEGYSSTDFAGSYITALNLSTQPAKTFYDFIGGAALEDIYFNILVNFGELPDGYAESENEGDYIIGMRYRYNGDDYEYRTNLKGLTDMGFEPDENGWYDISVPATLFDDDAALGTFEFGDFLRFGVIARRNYGSGATLPLTAENGGVFWSMSFDNVSVSVGGPHHSSQK